MDIKDLKSGDVLLFSPEKDSWISDAIVFLTGAPVSHTAMTYKTSADIIEETVPHVRVAPAAERFKERTIHVMRDEKHTDFTPVINASTKYLNDLEPYGMTNLYLVGMILIYKKFTHTSIRQKAVIEILKLLVAKLLPIINDYKYPDKKPMVCSEFVFQCYQDAGADYELSITDGNLLGVEKSATEQSNLLELAVNHKPLNKTGALLQGSHHQKIGNVDGDKILAQLKSDSQDSEEVSSELLDLTHQLARSIHALESKTSFDEADSLKGLDLLQKQQAMFVTPADLLLHCENLTKVGLIKI